MLGPRHELAADLDSMAEVLLRTGLATHTAGLLLRNLNSISYQNPGTMLFTIYPYYGILV